MSTQIDTAFVNHYRSTLFHLVQQKGSRLRQAVRIEKLQGEFGFYDQIGASEAVERSARHGDSPLISTPHSRRRVSARDFEWGDLIDSQDKLRLLHDPSSAYLQSAVWALGRKIDDLVVEAALGTAYTGKAGTTPVPLPAPRKVAADSTGLTLAKLLEAKELLDAAEADPDEPRFVAVTARQVTNLLNTTEVKSADYNTAKALAQGEVDSFLGFRFLRTERLTRDGGGNRQVIAWTKSGLLLALPQDVDGRITERPDKSFATYVYARLTCGSTRMEEDRVVEIACVE